jgi:hypothetical protein
VPIHVERTAPITVSTTGEQMGQPMPQADCAPFLARLGAPIHTSNRQTGPHHHIRDLTMENRDKDSIVTRCCCCPDEPPRPRPIDGNFPGESNCA